MLQKYLTPKNIKILIWIGALVAVVLLMWLSWPKGTLPAPAVVNANVNAPEVNAPAGTPAANQPLTAPAANAPKPVPIKKNTNTKVTGFAEKRTPHFVSSNIANNATLTSAPSIITIIFDATLNKTTDSFITVKRDQLQSATRGDSYIGGDGKTLNVNLNPQVLSGDYYVYYVACFADTGCKDGRFGYRLRIP